MFYVIINQDKVPEVREDQHDLPKGATEITEDEYKGLIEGSLKFEKGKILPVT